MTLQASTTPALPSPQKILQEIFGYSDFRPPQDEIIATVVTGGDALVLMPTGAVNPFATRYRRWPGPVVAL